MNTIHIYRIEKLNINNINNIGYYIINIRKNNKMQTLINMLCTFRIGLKLPNENFSHAASIFQRKGKKRYFKFY